MDSHPTQHPVLDAEQQTDWYLAYTKPKSEDIGLHNLLKQGFQAWCPRIKVVADRHRAQTTLESGLYKQEVLFPRYLFLRPAHAGQSISSVRSTIGITKLVSFGFEPARLSHEQLMRIARSVQQQQALSAAEVMQLKPGTSVKIAGGPLTGLDALVRMTAKDRVIVLIDLLGKPHTVALPYADVAIG